MARDGMQFSVLALAYDGTIADEGVLTPKARQAIRAARAHGVTVVIVTGRSLDNLRQVLGNLHLVDAVVVENGAVIAFPGSGRSSWRTRHPSPCSTRSSDGTALQRGLGRA
jgi:hydroxymethylpyrimidine pyrophosphatase-like HAD family hydrolase